ncbi:MAG TPA: hypothetical protein VNK95_23805, partial [Caldilineaceae bacterium]|nr:hypothetical protein [Caldilineaceae bacterium]
TNGPFSYFFRGRTLPITFWHEADYAIVYAQDWQRQLPSRKAVAYFQQLTPEQVITVDGLDYAHIYDLRGAPLPGYVIDWVNEQGEAAIRLVSYQLAAAPIKPGETVRAIFYLLNRAPIATNLSVLVRVVGAKGEEIARAEGWPWGAATSSWQEGVVWPDGHDLTIPATTPDGYYRVELGFYDPETQALLPAVQAASAAPLGDLATVDVIQVGELPRPAQSLHPPVAFGNQALLLGATWQTADGEALDPDTLTLRSGEPVTVRLFWQAQQWMGTDYTAFVHLVGPDGALAAQADQPPLGGFWPTSAWPPGQQVADTFVLALPADAPPGEYRFVTGLYDPATVTRLPVSRSGKPLGDAFLLTTVQRER